MIQSTPGIFAQSDYVAGPTPFTVYAQWTLGVSGASWRVIFDNNNSSLRSFSATFGSGESTHRTLTYNDDTMLITCQKLNNGGLAQDSVLIEVYNESGPTLLDTASYVVTNDVSSVTFNLTGLVAGDVVYVSLNEG